MNKTLIEKRGKVSTKKANKYRLKFIITLIREKMVKTFLDYITLEVPFLLFFNENVYFSFKKNILDKQIQFWKKISWLPFHSSWLAYYDVHVAK